jgi:hypothetical protein
MVPGLGQDPQLVLGLLLQMLLPWLLQPQSPLQNQSLWRQLFLFQHRFLFQNLSLLQNPRDLRERLRARDTQEVESW